MTPATSCTTARKVRQYAYAECVPGAWGRRVALSIVARVHRSLRGGKWGERERKGPSEARRRKEGRPRNKAVAPVTLERAADRVINARRSIGLDTK